LLGCRRTDYLIACCIVRVVFGGDFSNVLEKLQTVYILPPISTFVVSRFSSARISNSEKVVVRLYAVVDNRVETSECVSNTHSCIATYQHISVALEHFACGAALLESLKTSGSKLSRLLRRYYCSSVSKVISVVTWSRYSEDELRNTKVLEREAWLIVSSTDLRQRSLPLILASFSDFSPAVPRRLLICFLSIDPAFGVTFTPSSAK
jgi:hypothetical protein